MITQQEIEKAAEILKRYNLKLAPEWEGIKECWHRWHQHEFLKCWPTTYKEYIMRIVEIDRIKPLHEQAIRFKAFRPVIGIFNNKADADFQKADSDFQKANADLQKADSDFQKADADLHKANADFQKADSDFQKADADLQKADADLQKAAADWKKAYADLQKAAADVINKSHQKECSDIPFDEKMNSLIFTKG